AAADDRGSRRAVMWRAKRRGRDERAPTVDEARDGVDPGDLERALPVERRQDAGEPPAEHGLARAGRTRQEEVVAAGRGNRERDRQVEAGALLPQLGRREIDGDAAVGELQLGRGYPAPHALARFLARTVGEPDDREARQAVANVRLDVDAPRLEADQSMSE